MKIKIDFENQKPAVGCAFQAVVTDGYRVRILESKGEELIIDVENSTCRIELKETFTGQTEHRCQSWYQNCGNSDESFLAENH